MSAAEESIERTSVKSSSRIATRRSGVACVFSQRGISASFSPALRRERERERGTLTKTKTPVSRGRLGERGHESFAKRDGVGEEDDAGELRHEHARQRLVQRLPPTTLFELAN